MSPSIPPHFFSTLSVLAHRPTARSLCTHRANTPAFVDDDPDARAAEQLLDAVVSPSSDSPSDSAATAAQVLRARALAERGAARGSPRAQTLLGVLLLRGMGPVSPDRAAAATLLRAAAERGDPHAQMELGQMFAEEAARARADLEERAGHAAAADVKVVMEATGDGASRARFEMHGEEGKLKGGETPAQLVRRERKERRRAGFTDEQGKEFEDFKEEENRKAVAKQRSLAIEWLKKAALQGLHEAEVALGNLLVDDDVVEAVRLYESAAKSAHVPSAHFNLGQIYFEGAGAASVAHSGLDNAEGSGPRGYIARDRKLALKHLSMAAQLGDSSAQFYVGHLYRVGDEGVPQNDALALQFVQLAAKQHHPGATYYLALMHRNGEGALEASQQYFRKHLNVACKLGSPEALNCLADMYFKGTDGVELDYSKALRFYEKAGRNGEVSALCSAAAMYFHGHGCDADHHKAFLLYQDAAVEGSIRAMQNLGAMYFNGHGVPRSETIAEQFFRAAEDKQKKEGQLAAAVLKQGPKTAPAPPRAMPHSKTEANNALNVV